VTHQNDASSGLGDLRTLAVISLPLTLATVIVAIGLSLLITLNQDSEYDATAKLAFTDTSTDVSLSGVASAPTQTPAQLAAAGLEQVQRAGVAIEVAKALGENLPGVPRTLPLEQRQERFADRVRNALTVSVEPSSSLVAVKIRWPDGLGAAQIANLVAVQTANLVTDQTRRRYAGQAAELNKRAKALPRGARGSVAEATRTQYQSQVGRLVTLSTLAQPAQVATRAQTPDDPATPKPVSSAAIAGFLGLILGIGITVLRLLLDRRVRDTAELETLMGRPVIGEFPEPVLGIWAPLFHTHTHQAGLLVDRARVLRKNLDFQDGDDRPAVVVVTSSTDGEGKSTVAGAMAVACASGGERVLLVDADLRRPVVATRFEVQNAPGLSDYLTGANEPQDVIRVPVATNGPAPLGAENLVVLPAGAHVSQPADLLDSERFRRFLSEAREAYDRIIIDTAPLLPVADTATLVIQADVVVYCCRIDDVRKDTFAAGRDQLEHLGATRLAITATGIGKRRATGSGAAVYDGYGYYSPDARGGAASRKSPRRFRRRRPRGR
jgi:capsular exopolysaccharide synthesis family protein